MSDKFNAKRQALQTPEEWGGEGRYFGPSIKASSLSSPDMPVEEQLQQPLDLSLGGVKERLHEATVAPARDWWEQTPRTEKFMNVLQAATDVFQPQGKAVSGASMLFGSKELRGAMTQVMKALKRAKIPGTEGQNLISGLLRTTGKGTVLSPSPRSTAAVQAPAGSFSREVPDAGLEAARLNKERIQQMRDNADLWERMAPTYPKAEAAAAKKNAVRLRESADAELKQHERHLKRLQTHRRRQIEKYESAPTTPEIAVGPKFSAEPNVEFHEVAHAADVGQLPGRSVQARQVMEKSDMGDWLRKQQTPGGEALYPKEWTELPGEQLAEGLTAVAQGRRPDLTIKETQRLQELLGIELEKLKLSPF